MAGAFGLAVHISIPIDVVAEEDMDHRTSMTRRQTKRSSRNTQEEVGKYRLFYEIYPDLRWQVTDSYADWFEVALHVEMPEYRPASHPESRAALSALMNVANLLMQQAHSLAPHSVSRARPYFTLHAPASGDLTQTMLSRTLSLVFSNVGSYTQLREPSILTELKNQLRQLNVSRFQRSAETLCK